LQLHDKITRFKSHVSLITNVWSSNQNLGYLGVTTHYIDEQFEFHKKIIAFKQSLIPITHLLCKMGLLLV
jgi:hypothetical protein